MKTNSLKYTTTKNGINFQGDKADVIIKIRLDDQCKNGHQDFAITGTIYKAGKRGDRNMLTSSAIGDYIANMFPELAIFNRLHLCDAKGVPMYAVENGFYHLREGFNSVKPTDKEFKNEFCKYYRINPQQFDAINTSEHELVYAINLKELGILEQWNAEAEEAIKILENLTGNKFVNDSERSQYKEPKIEEIQNYHRQREAGYYSLENIRNRAKQKRIQDKRAKIQAIKNDCEKGVSKLEEERNVKLWLISHIEKIGKKALNRKKGFTLDFNFDNFIFYNHTKEIQFNWLDYKHAMSEKEFNMFCDNLTESDFNKLPNGVKFNLEGVKMFSR